MQCEIFWKQNESRKLKAETKSNTKKDYLGGDYSGTND